MEFIILFLIILVNSIAISNILKRKIELAIPISVILITIIVYIAGLFDNLNIGVIIVEIVSLISLIYNIIKLVKDIKAKKQKEELSRIFTPRTICIYSTIFIIYYNK